MTREVLREQLGTISHIGHREVRFSGSESAAAGLRTADDVFQVTGRIPDIGHTRDSLPELARLAAGARLREGAAGVEVSASFLGRRNFNRYDAEDVVGRALSDRLGLPYHSRRAGTAPPPGYAGWRLTMDGQEATLMARVAGRPLHRRDYKRHAIPGTLHPPVAAAMALLAEPGPGQQVLDPCCGAGTVLIEAGRLQPQARLRGYDLDPGALAAARANAAASGTPVAFGRGDAARLPLPDRSVDRVLTNPPWGGQVPPGGRLSGTPGRLWAEIRRVLRPDGRAVVLIPDTAALASAIGHGLLPAHVQHVSLSGAHPHIVLLTPAPDRL
ncbi:methyltransferase domain-containing protein [Microtetraspora sp. NBRC 13810]|uniref:TRM11 family SAM-dependent methyltransferase n=1 Tax=Microtetraspora sp. NBRC 13810 TaxID=3030990 RepID=UPI0025532E8A|nr:methyltransferase domain-containing protein [Microtetraspora sp. NBRC 13810]